MKLIIHQGDVKEQQTFTWDQVTAREGVYKETGGAEHLRYVTCHVTDKLKTACVNMSTDKIIKPYSGNYNRKYVEAPPLTITFAND